MAFQFNQRRQRYETESGRAIPSTKVREWIDGAVDKTKSTIVGFAERYAKGQASLPEFITEAKQELKAMHNALGMVAVGGKESFTAQHRGRLGSAIREQYKYFDRLALQLESGEQKSDGSLLSRVSMYADAGIGTYERLRKASHVDAGFTQEKNILGGNNSCAECPEETSKGWQAIGTLKAIGSRECLTRCRCHFDYK
jgi:hypothetical protein